MANEANILQALNMPGNYHGLMGTSLIGVVSRYLETPVNLTKSGVSGYYAVLDMLAIVVEQQDYFADMAKQARNGVYLTAGEVLVCLKDTNAKGKLVQVRDERAKLKLSFSAGSMGKHRDVQYLRWALDNTSTGGKRSFTVQGMGYYVLDEQRMSESEQKYRELSKYIERLTGFVELKHGSEVGTTRPYHVFEGHAELPEDKYLSGQTGGETPAESGSPKEQGSFNSAIKMAEKGSGGHKLDLVHNLTVQEPHPKLGSLENLQAAMQSSKEAFIANLAGEYSQADTEEFDEILHRLVSLFKNRTNASGVGTFADKVLNINDEAELDAGETAEEADEKVSKQAQKARIVNSIRMDDAQRSIETGFGVALTPDKIYALMLSNALNIRVWAILKNLKFAEKLGIPYKIWGVELLKNPYKVALLSGVLSVQDCVTLEMAGNGFFQRETAPLGIESEVSIFRDLLIMFEKQKETKGSTILPASELQGGRVTLKSLNLTDKSRHLLGISSGQQIGIKARIVQNNELGISDANEVRNLAQEWGILFAIHTADKEDVLVIFTHIFSREIFIYKTLLEIGSQPTGVSDSLVAKVIEEFEKKVGFSLEDLQKDGVKISQHQAGVLSGCAGSGKTTTSECIVDVFTEFAPDRGLYFAAPTGKAARRMSEVLGRQVKTLHSLFKIAGDLSESPLEDIFNVDAGMKLDMDIDEKSIFIFDEMAMCTNNLLYLVLKNLPANSWVYFLGDIKQLPPIGKGLPFKELMGLLPTVELGVSKRAASGSKINSNCDLINHNSEVSGVVPLEVGDDFAMVGATDPEIANEIFKIVRAELDSGKSVEDIQVITPYGAAARPTSANALNPKLQEIFNPRENLFTVSSYYRQVHFRLRDRVIHTNSNKYAWRRYIKTTEGSRVLYTEVQSHGVVNGDVGYIVGLTRCLDADFELISAEDGSRDKLRSDEGRDTDKDCFVELSLYDNDLEQDVVVLYHTKLVGNPSFEEFTGYNVTRGDLEFLSLAYALTTHKMQGSQSKVVIASLTSTDRVEFVNRNMLYTAISRAQEKVYLVGSVGNTPNSTLTRSRVSWNKDGVHSVLRALVEKRV